MDYHPPPPTWAATPLDGTPAAFVAGYVLVLPVRGFDGGYLPVAPPAPDKLVSPGITATRLANHRCLAVVLPVRFHTHALPHPCHHRHADVEPTWTALQRFPHHRQVPHGSLNASLLARRRTAATVEPMDAGHTGDRLPFHHLHTLYSTWRTRTTPLPGGLFFHVTASTGV